MNQSCNKLLPTPASLLRTAGKIALLSTALSGVLVTASPVLADVSVNIQIDAPPPPPRQEVVVELYRAAIQGIPPVHSGAWGMATLEVCLAILQSAQEGREIQLAHQVAIGE